MQKFCNILLSVLVLSNMIYFSFFSVNNPAESWGTVDVGLYSGTNHNPDLTVYSGDIYYIKGLRLYTESGEVDSTFTTKKDLSKFLEQHSADTYKNAMQWEIDRAISDYSSVLVMNTGEIFINYCYPYDEERCYDLILNGKECDNYGSCLYFNEE